MQRQQTQGKACAQREVCVDHASEAARARLLRSQQTRAETLSSVDKRVRRARAHALACRGRRRALRTRASAPRARPRATRTAPFAASAQSRRSGCARRPHAAAAATRPCAAAAPPRASSAPRAA
eukprot:4093326-Pleurochrysis_carterae.AAC.1